MTYARQSCEKTAYFQATRIGTTVGSDEAGNTIKERQNDLR